MLNCLAQVGVALDAQTFNKGDGRERLLGEVVGWGEGDGEDCGARRGGCRRGVWGRVCVELIDDGSEDAKEGKKVDGKREGRTWIRGQIHESGTQALPPEYNSIDLEEPQMSDMYRGHSVESRILESVSIRRVACRDAVVLE